jgi:hypothetical protein
MTPFTFVLFYLQIILNEQTFINIQNVYLVENNFWGIDQDFIKTDSGFLYNVSIDLEDEGCIYGFDYTKKTCFYLKSTGFRYAFLAGKIADNINLFRQSPENNQHFIKIHFYFTDQPIQDRNHFNEYDGKKNVLVTYKLLERDSDGIKLKSDGINIRMHHIKDIFAEFVYMKLLKLNESIIFLDEKRTKGLFEGDVDFNLHFFDNYSECLKNFKTFVSELNYFYLEKHYVERAVFTAMHSGKTTLKVSELKDFLVNKFNEEMEKTNNNIEQNESIIFLKFLYKKHCDYFIKEMLKNNIFFPIGDKFNIEFYLLSIFEYILKSIKSRHRIFEASNSEKKKSILNKMLIIFDSYLERLGVTATKELCESAYVHNHFSGLLKKKIETLEDYVAIEKMVCDYHNMFVYITNLTRKVLNPFLKLLKYVSPIFIDNYHQKIVDAIEIIFRNDADFIEICGLDCESNKVILEKDTDYYLNNYGKFFCTIDNLKKKNIVESEIVSVVRKFGKKFKVVKYLKV